uniref:Glucose-6-phosphate isomerase n=1 Tax=Chromera velia CCMP2878 TaxID=1169474 RepID=A0A0G4HDB2_9ALVE|eukprot:Cvel_6428.t1-p1 / transcript=Cvel_6428.t1 / gene=Cvel_6428 / organism=Chromera_velia_CCMP2878 / gene_product=Glucose-6-phosphate isomerase, cytosolic, putative / transcript_product=Glucose-6-phosphate isomerase, cytosolic, putative / location=Cvel_scaffold314:72910-81460(+) / protein_length=524 / sequence_SO=supercontig / SO=protein_coding / is_pseudo=false
MQDESRNEALFVKCGDIVMDFCREKMDTEVFTTLLKLAVETDVAGKIKAQLSGKKINSTEGRAVLHTALRAPADTVVEVDGKNVIPDVHTVLNRMKRFAESVRRGDIVGHTGKVMKDVVCIGIGGSYLGPEFVFEALRTEEEAVAAASGRRLRFLANVDPIDVKRALEGLMPETTLVVIVSKTFTTAETMMNARTVKAWLLQSLRSEAAVSKHMVAVSTNIHATSEFGVNPDHVFGFWDWVGGRFSVCSAVGILPLALQYGWGIVQKFLDGCHFMDQHYATAPLDANLPVLLGLISVWNANFMGYSCNALLPYCQSLLKFAPHIQQVAMESNGKRVTIDGQVLSYEAEQIFFGEPGTNGQHSFYQLLHQGRVVPCEFIGFAQSQNPVHLTGEAVSNHDELMANFFAQPDALAFGKSREELEKANVPASLIPHKEFPGDRPSLSILMPKCTAFAVGSLLALYEHRVAVQGFLWNVNSFDQWGVELGKVLAKEVRNFFGAARKGDGRMLGAFHPATQRLLQTYMDM